MTKSRNPRIGVARRLVFAAFSTLLLLYPACTEVAVHPISADSDPIVPSATPSTTAQAPAANSAAIASSVPPLEPQNVVLITIDSMRSDMPWMGYERDIAPHLTELAKKSIVYTRAYSISSATAKSLGGLFASKYPSEMPRSYDYFTRYSAENTMLTEVLRDQDMNSGVVQTFWALRHDWGYGSGAKFWKAIEPLPDGKAANHQVTSHLITPVFEELIDELAKTSDGKPFFAWAHYMDPHQSYQHHAEAPDWGNSSRDLYDGEIWFTDKWVGRLIDWVHNQPWAHNTTIIVTADHGEAIDEHHMGGHGFELWESLIHVPLIISLPSGQSLSIDTPRSHIDLAPTIVELMGGQTPSTFRGKSLKGDWVGEHHPRVVVCDLPEDAQSGRRRAVIDGPLKWVRGRQPLPMLFDLHADPEERSDLRQTRTSDFERLAGVAASIPRVKAKK